MRLLRLPWRRPQPPPLTCAFFDHLRASPACASPATRIKLDDVGQVFRCSACGTEL